MGTLFVGNFKFSKGELERFIHCILKCFPNTNRDSARLGSSWDDMGRKLHSIQASGDLSIAKFFPLFHIIKSTELLGNGLGDVSGPLLKAPSCLCSSCVPKPSPRPEGQSTGGCHYDAQGGF